MQRPTPTRRILRWLGTPLCIVLIAAALYSTRRDVVLRGPAVPYEIRLAAGAVNVVWWPADWQIYDDRYAGGPGWSIDQYGGDLIHLSWWPEFRGNRSWYWFTVPLWIPFVLIAIPMLWAWYRDRGVIPAFRTRCVEWLRPPRRIRPRPRHILIGIVVHFFAAALFVKAAHRIPYFFFPPHPSEFGQPRLFDTLLQWTGMILGFAAPLWGLLLAGLYVRFRNELLYRSPRPVCFDCGYDLTGSVSDRCPECGSPILDAPPRGSRPRSVPLS